MLDLAFNYICKFGIAAAFQGCYLASGVLFPIIFASTTFGACNLMGTISAFFSVDVYSLYSISEWYSFAGLCIVGIIISFLLKERSVSKSAKE